MDVIKEKVSNVTKSWQTTVGAIVVILSQILPEVGITLSAEIQSALVVIGVAIIGLFAKDSNVTGGTRSQKS